MNDAREDMTVGQFARSLGLTLTARQLTSAGCEATDRSHRAGLPVRRAYAGNKRRKHYAMSVLASMADGLRAMANAGPDAVCGPVPGGLWWAVGRVWRRHPAIELIEAEHVGAAPETIDALRTEVFDWLGVEIVDDNQEPEPEKPGREGVAAAMDAMIDVIPATRDDDDPGPAPSLWFLDDLGPAADDDWLTVREFALPRGHVLSDGQLASIGHEASQRCRREGIEPGRKFDGRRMANCYPPAVLHDMLAGIEAIAAAGFDATEGLLPDGGWWRVWRPWSRVGDRAQAAV